MAAVSLKKKRTPPASPSPLSPDLNYPDNPAVLPPPSLSLTYIFFPSSFLPVSFRYSAFFLLTTPLSSLRPSLLRPSQEPRDGQEDGVGGDTVSEHESQEDREQRHGEADRVGRGAFSPAQRRLAASAQHIQPLAQRRRQKFFEYQRVFR